MYESVGREGVYEGVGREGVNKCVGREGVYRVWDGRVCIGCGTGECV